MCVGVKIQIHEDFITFPLGNSFNRMHIFIFLLLNRLFVAVVILQILLLRIINACTVKVEIRWRDS